MNYLAHLFLSGTNEGIILGNILEDYTSGNIENEKNKTLPKDVKLGLMMHRQIDTLTDTHQTVKLCKEVFYEKFGKYSPIIIDVIFDHYLLKNWVIFTEESFEDFRPRVYKALQTNLEIQPQTMKDLVSSMIHHDWLKNYIETWGIERAFMNLNKRINKPEIDLTKSIEIFEENYYFLNENFLIFFEELKKHCDKFLKEHQLYGKQ